MVGEGTIKRNKIANYKIVNSIIKKYIYASFITTCVQRYVFSTFGNVNEFMDLSIVFKMGCVVMHLVFHEIPTSYHVVLMHITC